MTESRRGSSSEVERKLGVALHPDLRALLEHSNGVDLFRGASVIFGKHMGRPPFQVADLADVTIQERRERGVRSDTIVFGQRDTGDLFVLYPTGEAGVLDISTGREQRFRSLTSWLKAEIKDWLELHAETADG